ncbi:MAG: hypothetical protein ACREXM_07425 [Gammaproteobacteria bacterium]
MSASSHVAAGIESGDAGVSASNPRNAWVETCTLTSVALLACLWSDPDNPLLAEANFPWWFSHRPGFPVGNALSFLPWA